MAHPRELKPEELYRQTDPSQFGFETTAEVPDFDEIIGQPRAVEAVQFGMGIQRDGYNIFAMGNSGTGKHSLILHFIEDRAAQQPVPSDWCYVHNFQEPYKPNALRLPPGTGVRLRRDMEMLIKELRSVLSTAFESEEYRSRRQVMERDVKEQQERALTELQRQAQAEGLTLLRSPVGVVFAPVRNNEVIAPEEYQKLPEEDRKRLEQSVEKLQSQLQAILAAVPAAEREGRARVRELDREFARLAIRSSFDILREGYTELPEVVSYIGDVEADVVENAAAFFAMPSGDAPSDETAVLEAPATQANPLIMRRYRINVIVDRSGAKGAPVIYADNPNYTNLVGKAEHQAHMGALVTDFNLIRPGALHLANGGYLLLDARQLLLQPYAWEGLKRALQACYITIEPPAQAMGMISTVSLEPEPIPLELKVTLVGDRALYYLLATNDPDFDRFFKVQADFSEEMYRDADSQVKYAHLLATLARREKLRPLTRHAVARIIEHSARMVSDSEKMSTRMRNMLDLMREADYWATQTGSEPIEAMHVQQAIDTQIHRADRVRERVHEEIQRGTILVDTQGAAVGQINGLSVMQFGGFAFGQPSRITARVRLGEGEVVNIEREVEMSGPLHSKGVLILAGFLGARYAAEQPLSLSASLVFEQSYGGVDGDSASSAELYALLSAISGVPIKQSLAVTGSVNQNGQVQAIGGANEKIEGFFDICQARGLDGSQGVLIPATNVKHLMLRQDVVQAVTDGRFHIYPVEHVDQGIEILTGVPAGERAADGSYLEGSINALVQTRLIWLAERRIELGLGSVRHREGDRRPAMRTTGGV